MDIYLIRHTKVNIAPGVCYGISDVGLAESFVQETELILNKLPALQNLEIISSPLKRCVLLAEKISRQPFKTDKRLVELNFGEWEMLNWNNIMAHYADTYKNWELDYINTAPPNGESFLNLYKRSAAFIDEVMDSKQKQYAVIAHGGPIRAMVAHVLSIPLNKAFNLTIDYGSVTKLSINGQLKTVRYVNR